MIKKSDLKCGDIVEFANGRKEIFDGKNIVSLSDFSHIFQGLDNYDDDLHAIKFGYDIALVHRLETGKIFLTKRTLEDMELENFLDEFYEYLEED